MSKILKSRSFSIQHAKCCPSGNVATNNFLDPSQPIINDAMNKAQEILDEAKKEAEDIVRKAEIDSHNIKSEAEQRGFNEGYNAGVSEGKSEIKTSAEEGINEIKDLVKLLEAEKRKLREDSLKDITKISFEIAKKVMRQHIEADKDAIVRMLNEIIAENEEGIKIYISEYSQTLKAIVDRSIAKRLVDNSKGAKVIVTKNDDLLMVETDNGMIDMSVPTQLKRLEEVL